MKRIIMAFILLGGLIIFWGSPVFGEEWNTEQKEVIKALEARWELLKGGNLEAFLDGVRDDALTWGRSYQIPGDKKFIKEDYTTWMTGNRPKSFKLQPLSVHIFDNVASIFYQIEWKGRLTDNVNRLRSMTIMVKQDDKWMRLHAMSVDCDKPPPCLEALGVETYIHEKPTFTVKYPNNYKPLNPWSESELLRVRDPMRGSFVVNMMDIPENVKLVDEGKRIADVYKSRFDPNLKLVASEQMNTQDGTPATIYKMEWEWRTRAMKTIGLSVFKDNKKIGLLYHFPSERQNWGGDIEAEAREIFKSLNFK